MKSKIICLECNKEVFIENREITRGQKFCSQTCSSIYNNRLRPLISLKCQASNCNNIFESKNTRAKYCSKQCSYTAQKLKLGKTYCNRSTLSTRILKAIGKEKFCCFICGWNEESSDIHHILPRAQGGTNDFSNLTILCPNHHRLADRGKLLHMPTVSDKLRTISSSENISELGAQAGN